MDYLQSLIYWQWSNTWKTHRWRIDTDRLIQIEYRNGLIGLNAAHCNRQSKYRKPHDTLDIDVRYNLQQVWKVTRYCSCWNHLKYPTLTIVGNIVTLNPEHTQVTENPAHYNWSEKRWIHPPLNPALTSINFNILNFLHQTYLPSTCNNFCLKNYAQLLITIRKR